MDAKYFEEIKVREQAATLREWKVVCQGNTVPSLQVVTETYWERPIQIKICSSISPKREADADFIANARTDIPALIAEIEHLREIHANWMKEEMEVQGQLRTERDTLKKALGMIQSEFGSYLGNYSADYFIQQAQEQEENHEK